MDNPQSAPELKPAVSPSLPTMFTSKQGIFLIIILTLAVVGWVLYFNAKQQVPEPHDEDGEEMAAQEEGTAPYSPVEKNYVGEAVALPAPRLAGPVSLEEALKSRRSRRDYDNTTVSLEDFSQMLWAAQGVTDETSGGRTAPSARSIYPFNFYAIVRNVVGVQPGLYHYIPEGHMIRPLVYMDELLTDDSQQETVKTAPVVLVYGAIYDKTREKFAGDSAVQVTLQESGHIGQNLYLQAEVAGLATNVVGGFDPEAVKENLSLSKDETVVYLQPFGNRVAEEDG